MLAAVRDSGEYALLLRQNDDASIAFVQAARRFGLGGDGETRVGQFGQLYRGNVPMSRVAELRSLISRSRAWASACKAAI